MAIHPDAFIHEMAYVEDGATIGKDSRIWPFAHIRDGAVIGEDSNISKDCYVDDGGSVGDRCKIGNNVNVHAGITVGDEVFIGPGTVFTNDMFPRAVSPEWVMLETVVHRGVSIGANVAMGPGVTVGEYATIGIGSTVIRDVEAHELVVGNPARRLGWMCKCGRVASRDETRPADLRCEVCIEQGVAADG